MTSPTTLTTPRPPLLDLPQSNGHTDGVPSDIPEYTFNTLPVPPAVVGLGTLTSEEQLKSALESKDRIFLLVLAKEIESFLTRDDEIMTIRSGPTSKYQRMLVYKLAEWFGVKALPGVDGAMMIGLSGPLDPKSTTLHLANLVPRPPSPPQQFRIMQRTINSEAGPSRATSVADDEPSRAKTIEEREQAYALARAKIYGNDDPKIETEYPNQVETQPDPSQIPWEPVYPSLFHPPRPQPPFQPNYNYQPYPPEMPAYAMQGGYQYNRSMPACYPYQWDQWYTNPMPGIPQGATYPGQTYPPIPHYPQGNYPQGNYPPYAYAPIMQPTPTRPSPPHHSSTSSSISSYQDSRPHSRGSTTSTRSGASSVRLGAMFPVGSQVYGRRITARDGIIGLDGHRGHSPASTTSSRSSRRALPQLGPNQHPLPQRPDWSANNVPYHPSPQPSDTADFPPLLRKGTNAEPMQVERVRAKTGSVWNGAGVKSLQSPRANTPNGRPESPAFDTDPEYRRSLIKAAPTLYDPATGNGRSPLLSTNSNGESRPSSAAKINALIHPSPLSMEETIEARLAAVSLSSGVSIGPPKGSPLGTSYAKIVKRD